MIEFGLKVGDNTYTLQTDLNVRTGPGADYPLQPREKMTDDGRKHSTGSTLHKGTRVTVLKIIADPFKGSAWIQIPSGYICGADGNNQYVK